MLHLAGDAAGDVRLRGQHEAGHAHVQLGGKPVHALGKGTRAGKACAQLVAQLARQVELGLLGEAAAGGHDDVGLVQVHAALLDGLGGDQLHGRRRSDPGDVLDGVRAGGLGALERARAHRVDGHVACGLLHALGHAAEVQADGAVLEGHDVGDDGGVRMGGQLAGDRLHVARGFHEHHSRSLGVEHRDHGVGGVVEDGPFRHGDAGDLIGDGLGGLAEGDEHDLVGHGASASAKLPSGIRAFSDNECFHEYQLCLSIA